MLVFIAAVRVRCAVWSDGGELGVVMTLAAEEKRVRDDCGLR